MGGDGALSSRARGAPTTYLSITKEPSGPVLLLFLLICSFFLYEFCFLNQNQQEFIFLPAPRGLSLGLQTECMGQLPLPPPARAAGRRAPTLQAPEALLGQRLPWAPSPASAASGERVLFL